MNVTSNDVFPSGCNATTVTIVTPPTEGTAVVTGTSITYTPDDPCYEGLDTFTYTVTCIFCPCSGVPIEVVSEEATVTLTIEHECDVFACNGDCLVCVDGSVLSCC